MQPLLYRQKSATQQLEPEFIGPNLAPGIISGSQNRIIYTILAHGQISVPLTDTIQHPDIIYTIYNDIGLVLPNIRDFSEYDSTQICREDNFINQYYQRSNYSVIPEHILTPDANNAFPAGIYNCGNANVIPIVGPGLLSDAIREILSYNQATFPGTMINIRCFFCSGFQNALELFNGLVWKWHAQHNAMPGVIPIVMPAFLKSLMKSVASEYNRGPNLPVIWYNQQIMSELLYACLDLYETELHNIRVQRNIDYNFFVNLSDFNKSIIQSLQTVYRVLSSRLVEPLPLVEQRYRDLEDAKNAMELEIHLPIGLFDLGRKKLRMQKQKSKKQKSKKSRQKSKKSKKQKSKK
jgi:hypothetical protein